MRVLLIIHGYPPRYNAGSEVYTQSLARGLADRHAVRVLTREEHPFDPPLAIRDETDPDDPRVAIRVLNNPESRDRYRHEGIDAEAVRLVREFRPDVAHVNHLSHLSTSMLAEIRRHRIPIVVTLHDFWFMCPRGQFMQRTGDPDGQPFPSCPGQEDRRCAERCYSLYFSGAAELRESEAASWTGWVRERMRHVRSAIEHVDAFIAPSRHLLARYRDEFGLPAAKLTYLDYGFDLSRLSGRRRVPEDGFVFGYIGTHIPAKGIHLLLEAFGRLQGSPRLRIWGRPRDPYTGALRRIAAGLPNGADSRIEWMGEYRNEQIVPLVFDRVDAIVVPSIWEENSPLVIHEAQQVGVPVVTSDVGGMAEYVRHEWNGMCFRHRDTASLSEQMQRLADAPELAQRLGARGYLYTDTGEVPSLSTHVAEVEAIYRKIVAAPAAASTDADPPGPWRITFDTNPDDCNLRCVMCEEHSPHSSLRAEREASGRPHRRMDIGLVRSVLDSCRGGRLREVIPSTMGEPLLYAHFDEFLDLCAQRGLKVNLTTNGTFPRRGARAWAELLVPACSDVKISINGARAATQERIMLGTRFESIVANVRRFVEVRDRRAAGGGDRCRVTFQTTFLDGNVDELPELVRLAASLGVDRVKGHHLWAHFVQIEGMSMRRSRASIERWNRVVDLAHEACERHPLPGGRRVLLENVHRLDPDRPDDLAPGGACPFLGEEAWISSEGRFNPCCAPDADRRTLGDFGNVGSRPLMSIWSGPEYSALRREYRDRPLCQRCNMRRVAVEP